MTVKELIEELECFDKDKEIVIAFPSGDYWGTVCANDVESVEEGEIIWSEYHHTNKLIVDYDESLEGSDDVKSVIVLSANKY